MGVWNYITSNPVLNATFFAWLTAQILKALVVLVTKHRLDLRMLVSSGGMPSSHSSTVICLSTCVARIEGVSSVSFAVCLVLSAIVMYDATGVRRAAGQQAKVLNQMIEDSLEHREENMIPRLKELLGHTPLEVFAGALLGLLFGITANL